MRTHALACNLVCRLYYARNDTSPAQCGRCAPVKSSALQKSNQQIGLPRIIGLHTPLRAWIRPSKLLHCAPFCCPCMPRAHATPSQRVLTSYLDAHEAHGHISRHHTLCQALHNGSLQASACSSIQAFQCLHAFKRSTAVFRHPHFQRLQQHATCLSMVQCTSATVHGGGTVHGCDSTWGRHSAWVRQYMGAAQCMGATVCTVRACTPTEDIRVGDSKIRG